MPLGLEEQLAADQLTSIARSEEERRKQSLAEALLGRFGANNLAEPAVSEEDQRVDDVATSLQTQAADKVRRSLMTALNPRRTSSLEDLVDADSRGGAETPVSGYVQPRKQNIGTPTPQRILMNDAQPMRPAALTSPVMVTGDTDPLDKYVKISPETQRQYHLEKHKDSSPEDAAAYLADRVEKAPHEAVDELNQWKDADSLAKRMQGREFALEEKQADKKDQARMRSYAPSMNNAMASARAEMAALPSDPLKRRDQMELNMGREQTRRNQVPTNPLLWAAMSGTGRGQLASEASSQRMALANAMKQKNDAEELKARNQRMNDKYLPDDAIATVGGKDDPRGLEEGTKISRNARGGIRMEGPGDDPAYLAKLGKQAGLSKALESLDAFKEQQRLNAQQVAQRGEQKSVRNLAALIAGRGGQKLSEADTDPATLRAYYTGLKQGPTMAQAMAFNRDESAKKRAEAERDNKLRLLAQLTAANRESPNPKMKAQIELLADELAGLPADSIPRLPSGSDKYTADELAGMVPRSGGGPAKLKPKGAATTSPKKDEKPPGLIGSLWKAMTRDPYAGMTKEEKDAAIKKAQEASPYRGRFGGV